MDFDEVDPRYSLANERTFLAWIRTALGLLAGSAGLLAVNLPWPEVVGRLLSGFLAAVAGLSAFLAWLRWRRVDEAIQARQPLPRARAHVVLAIAVAAVAAIVIILAAI